MVTRTKRPFTVRLVARSGKSHDTAEYQIVRFGGGQFSSFSDNFLAIYRTRSHWRTSIASGTTERHNAHYQKLIAWLSLCVIPTMTDVSLTYDTHPCFGGYQRWDEKYDAFMCNRA